MADNNIIIKRVKKGHAAHHGGAWKIAYADFVTAMMAFFLLMWLLETMTSYERQGIADYFNTTIVDALRKGLSSKSSTESHSMGYAKLKETAKAEDIQAAMKQVEQEEAERLKALKKRIEEDIESNAFLKQFKNQLLIDITSEGLRIQLVDEQNRAMFEMGSAELMPYSKPLLREIGKVLNEVPNRLGVSGHTDANPFSGGLVNYSNWELSTERANAARRELVGGGIDSNKILQVLGLAEAVPLDKANPLNPINRRISIVVMNNKTEATIVQSSGGKIDVKGIGDIKGVSLDPADHPVTPPAADPAAAKPGEQNAKPEAGTAKPGPQNTKPEAQNAKPDAAPAKLETQTAKPETGAPKPGAPETKNPEPADVEKTIDPAKNLREDLKEETH